MKTRHCIGVAVLLVMFGLAACENPSKGGGSNVAVTGVELNKTVLTLAVGAQETLSATIFPADATSKTLTWASSDEAVAAVSDGTVSAVAVGTATITVRTRDGGYTAACAVTVSQDGSIAVTGVTLNKTTLTLVAGGSGETLTYTIAPADATDKSVTWSSDDTAVATVVDGLVTPVAAGTATITVTTNDGGFTAACAVTVTGAENIAVSGVSLSAGELVLNTGSSATLVATVLPANATEQAVTWASADSAVATVDEDGLVTAIGTGATTITVTTVDGAKIDTCTVTVRALDTFNINLALEDAAAGSAFVTTSNGQPLTGLALSRAGTVTFTTTVNADWQVVGSAFTGTGTSFTVNPADAFFSGSGTYVLSIVAQIDGDWYSRTVRFTVTN